MSQHTSILNNLKTKGFRLTKARSGILKVMLNSRAPLSIQELNIVLKNTGLHVNKTTIYREVDFLKSQHIIRELNLGDGRRRYEKWPENHHHHLICVSCESIECVELEGCLETEEQKILRDNKFRTINHSLEFHGICEKCQ